MIQCAGCGSNLVYDIARKKMYCKACGNEYEPESVDKDEDSEERKLMELTVFIVRSAVGRYTVRMNQRRDSAVTAGQQLCFPAG